MSYPVSFKARATTGSNRQERLTCCTKTVPALEAKRATAIYLESRDLPFAKLRRRCFLARLED